MQVLDTVQKRSQTKFLIVIPEKCAGCRICEQICSLTKEGEFNPLNSRIHIVKREWNREWVGVRRQVVCQQCDPPICRSVCPNSAISRDPKTGAMIIDDKKCTKCTLCVKACPFGAIRLHTKKEKIIVCDLCGGHPTCVEWCPEEALKYTSLNLAERRENLDKLLALTESKPIKVVRRK
jgi:carbon-monoxide dehydrogenase iron sulfur subunit